MSRRSSQSHYSHSTDFAGGAHDGTCSGFNVNHVMTLVPAGRCAEHVDQGGANIS